MHVVLIKVGEPLPEIQAERQQRMGLLADELIRRGHRVTWLTNTADRRDGSVIRSGRLDYHTENGINVVAVRSIGYGTKVSLRRLADAYLTTAQIGFELLRLQKADLCVISLPLLEIAALVSPLARLRGIPTVVDIRDLYPDNYVDALSGRGGLAGRLLVRCLRVLAQPALRLPNARYAISMDYLRWAEDLAGPGTRHDRAIMLPFPGGLENPPEKTAREGGPTTAVFLGAFNRIIDLHTVIDAARSLEQTHPGAFKFVLAGDGEFRSELKHYADDCQSVSFPGWVGPAEVSKLLGGAHVGLAPYRVANASAMGNKYLEYLWSSLPVFTSDERIGQSLEQAGAGTSYRTADELATRLDEFRSRTSATSSTNASEFFIEELSRGQSHRLMATELESLVDDLKG